MDVNGFQDEKKIYKENIARINSIKNKKNIIIPYNKNNNDIYYINNNINKINSYDYNSKNLNKKNLNLINYSESNIKKKKFNISIDLEKSNLNIHNTIHNNIIYSNSEIIKNNIKKNIDLTNKEKRRQLICKSLYMNILNKMKQHINSLIEINKKTNKERQNEISTYNILNNKKNIQNTYDCKNKSIFNDEIFSFKGYILNNDGKSKVFNYNKKFESNKINNTKIFNNNNQIYKKVNLNNEVNQIIINNNNIIKNKLLEKNYKTKNKNNNIIINYSPNNINKHSQNNINNIIKITDNKFNFKPRYYSMRNSESNVNITNKNLINKYFYDKDTRSYNIINNQNNNINKKVKLIPNIKSITKNYFSRNQFKNNSFNNSIKYINTQINNSNNNLSNNLNNNPINNNTIYSKTIKLLDYKPLFSRNQKLQDLNNNINSNYHRVNSYKIIKPSSQNDNYFFLGKMKVIKINNNNRISTSPNHYIYKNNLINKNIQKIPKVNYSLANKKHFFNNYFSNEVHSYNFKRKNLIMENPFPMNNAQRIYIDKSKEKIKRYYSPLNTIINKNSNYFNINGKNNINNIRKYRSFNKMKESNYNFNFDYANDIKSLNYNPKNINYLNTKTNNYIIKQNCFNDKFM